MQEQDVNAEGSVFGSSLQAVSFIGHEVIVRILLGDFAHIFTRRRVYGDTLQAASSRGHDAVVKVLLGNGAYIISQVGRYSNSLQAASIEDTRWQ